MSRLHEMARPTFDIASALTAASVRHPRRMLALWLAVTAALAFQAAQLRSEVGYAAYFGPHDPAVERLESFFSEFDSGLHVLVAFSCPGERVCTSFREGAALELLGRLQVEIDELPNVLRTRSLLNTPIVTDPLETHTIGRRLEDRYALASDWEPLIARSAGEPFLAELVISKDERTAGVVVELQSLDSDRVREFVHRLLDLVPRFEQVLGGEVFVAGDPVWTVLSDDDLDADSRNLTLLMFAVITALLWVFFRTAQLVVLPLVAAAILAIAVHGVIALLGFPMTAILAALPPLLLVIALISSIHLMSARLRSGAGEEGTALIAASREIAAPCQWGVLTTAAGFASFVSSDLASFQQFGLVSALGLALGFLTTFSLLPALLTLWPLRERVALRAPAIRTLLAAMLRGAAARPSFVLAVGVGLMVLFAAGMPRLYYEVDFGDQSLVLRSVRFMEESFRRPMTTELVVTIPDGRRIYDPESLRLLARIEDHFRNEPSTGSTWSFLDFLEQAHRVNFGTKPESFEKLIHSVPADMPIVASFDGLASYWSETTTEQGDGAVESRDRARVSIHRSWLDGAEQLPYVDRVNAFVSQLNGELRASGYQVELNGGLELAALAERRIRETQWGSFGLSFAVVAGTLALVLARSPLVAAFAIAANLLPVIGLLGLMGWAGIAVDPANSMVAAILLAVADDDTVHMTLRYAAGRREGKTPLDALREAFASSGEAIAIATICLACGFAVLMFSRWGGLVSFGLLASLGVLFSLLADLLLFPAAVLTFWKKA